MKFLVDENLSPLLASELARAGYESTHVRDVVLESSPDREVLEFARTHRFVVVSADTDFGELLSIDNASGPSIILIRRQSHRVSSEIAALILANIAAFESDLTTGAVVVFDQERIRVRALPFR